MHDTAGRIESIEAPPPAAAWVDRWGAPPPDVAVATAPAGARAETARQIADHLAQQLARGRSLYCIVRDRAVTERIGGFDGRALPGSGASAS